MTHAEAIRPGMEVLGSSEKLIGVVDMVEGDEMVFVVQGPDAERLRIPLTCVEAVGSIVRLSMALDELRSAGQRDVPTQPIRHALAQEAEHGPGTV